MEPYVQRQRLGTAWFGFCVAVAVLLLAVNLAPGIPVAARGAILISFVIMLLVTWELDHVTILVTDAEVVAGFRLFKSRTSLGEIESVEVIQTTFWRHGIGFHITLPPAFCYVARTGPAIRIRRRGRLDVIVSCDDPAGARAAIDADGRSSKARRA